MATPEGSDPFDLSQMTGKINAHGDRCEAPAEVTGKSGVKHRFDLCTFGQDEKRPDLAVEVVKTDGYNDETKVLSFFIKVYDVDAKKAVLCGVPYLNNDAMRLASTYKIETLRAATPEAVQHTIAGFVDK